MNYAEILVREFGPPSEARRPTDEDLATLTDFPADLVALWKEHGWAGYGDGFYWTTDPRAFEDLVSDWHGLPRRAVVIGRDAFANLYLLHDGEVLQLNPHVDDWTMVAPTLDLFFRACLAMKSFREDYMWADLFREALQQHGPVAADECYGFFPALALGGSVDVASIRRVKMEEHLMLLAQLAG